ncbi:hypothetical protein LJR289_002293 [Pseudoduganella sp. LjRoot289]|uniref:hypothetical protein n=1 Tax=Pseudoduganella sp. LjRoot289 TaxID=3342314 RepID=UPI003ECEDBDC
MPGTPSAVTLDTLQRIADTALYAAKRSWRNGWVGVEPSAAGPGGAAIDERVQRFLADAEAAVAAGGMEVMVAPERAGSLRWG